MFYYDLRQMMLCALRRTKQLKIILSPFRILSFHVQNSEPKAGRETVEPRPTPCQCHHGIF